MKKAFAAFVRLDKEAGALGDGEIKFSLQCQKQLDKMLNFS